MIKTTETENETGAETKTQKVTRLTGTSGALIVAVPDNGVYKYDTPRTGTRVRDQGIWLSQSPVNELRSSPEVYNVLPDGYHMETLTRVPLEEQDVQQLVYDVLTVLEVEWWSESPVGVERVWVNDDLSDFSPRAHGRYVAQLCCQVSCRDLVKPLAAHAQLIDWHSLTRSLTHGDPIVDNVMYRSHVDSGDVVSELVLIDPLPPTVSVPPLRCVDVGRLIQSLVGYESARYDAVPRPRVSPILITELLNAAVTSNPGEFDLNEARAALYWSVIHMMRGLRTALNTPAESAVRDLAYYLVDRVVKPWMR